MIDMILTVDRKHFFHVQTSVVYAGVFFCAFIQKRIFPCPVLNRIR